MIFTIYLDNYLQTYLEKDIRAISEITNLALYRKIMNVQGCFIFIHICSYGVIYSPKNKGKI